MQNSNNNQNMRPARLTQCQSIILSQTHSITLKQPAKKISCLLPAYNNTFVFIRVDIAGAAESIIHISSKGENLYEYSFEGLIGAFAMLTEKQVIAVNSKKQQIDIINLQLRQIKSTQHKLMCSDAHQIEIITFYNSKLFCIVQKTPNQFKLTYYDYLKMKRRPLSQFIGKDEEWSLEHQIVKANNNSKIAWFSKTKQSEFIQIHTWDLSSNPKGQLSIILIKNSLKRPHSNFYIHHLWQNQPNIYTLITSNFYKNEEDPSLQITHNNCILDVNKNTVRKVGYDFKDYNGDVWNNAHFQYFALSQFAVFSVINIQGTTTTPVFYVNNETQSIVAIKQQDKTKNIKYYKPGYDPYSYVQAQYKNSNVQRIEVTVTRVAYLKQVFLHLMLHLNQNFNDDLLQDAVELLQ